MSYFEGKTAIVTGGASGIGKALSEQLSQSGVYVIVTDINADGVDRVVKGIIASGGKAEGLRLDVSKADEVKALVESTDAKRGLDFMFNNAGIGIGGEVRAMELDTWHKVADVNYWGVVNGTVAAYKAMIKRGKGHIVNTASGAGLMPTPLSIPYTATKYAVIGMTVALRAEAVGLGVNVSVVCPGFIDTPIFETSRYAGMTKEYMLGQLKNIRRITPEKCARAILKGVRKNKAIIPVTAEVWIMWWLNRLSPRLMSALMRVSVWNFRRNNTKA
jgi:NAD(P)-dependent dehydrogenase (short-subunit alcohol dehydrogenase family)